MYVKKTKRLNKKSYLRQKNINYVLFDANIKFQILSCLIIYIY